MRSETKTWPLFVPDGVRACAGTRFSSPVGRSYVLDRRRRSTSIPTPIRAATVSQVCCQHSKISRGRSCRPRSGRTRFSRAFSEPSRGVRPPPPRTPRASSSGATMPPFAGVAPPPPRVRGLGATARAGRAPLAREDRRSGRAGSVARRIPDLRFAFPLRVPVLRELVVLVPRRPALVPRRRRRGRRNASLRLAPAPPRARVRARGGPPPPPASSSRAPVRVVRPHPRAPARRRERAGGVHRVRRGFPRRRPRASPRVPRGHDREPRGGALRREHRRRVRRARPDARARRPRPRGRGQDRRHHRVRAGDGVARSRRASAQALGPPEHREPDAHGGHHAAVLLAAPGPRRRPRRRRRDRRRRPRRSPREESRSGPSSTASATARGGSGARPG